MRPPKVGSLGLGIIRQELRPGVCLRSRKGIGVPGLDQADTEISTFFSPVKHNRRSSHMITKKTEGKDLMSEDWLLEKTKCDGCDCSLKQIAECPDAQDKGRHMSKLGQRGDPCGASL